MNQTKATTKKMLKHLPKAKQRQLDYREDSCRYFEQIRHLPYPLLLDSNAQATHGRYDILSADPCEIIDQRSDWQDAERLFDRAQQAMEQHTSSTMPAGDLPFISGAIGIFSYDFGRRLEGLRHKTTEPRERWPEVQLGIYQWAIVQDHSQKTAWLVGDAKLDSAYWRSLNRLLDSDRGNVAQQSTFRLTTAWKSNTSKQDYRQLYQRSMDYIHAGDCYQINLAQRFSAKYHGDTWQAYKRLRQYAATPYAAYFERPGSCVASLSPERFIHNNNGAIETRPIKGTRRRGINPQEDAQLMASLHSSQKDRAENLMIVDLLRNDLGKCCIPGSIAVPSLFQLESHSNVHHLSSTITGKLVNNSTRDVLAVLRHGLPGGSVTGAPKRRAMEIIDELEHDARSIYCGSVAYIDSRGRMDSNILIRSLLFQREPQSTGGGNVDCWGGGGIVADSDCNEEHQESLDKISNILDALSSHPN